MKKDVKRLIRGISFLISYLFFEKPKGLDFSMRQKNIGIKSEGNHGYALTQKKSFDEIMKYLPVSEKDSFIDIGCGKGGVMRYALDYGFGKVAGIEVEESLYKIADNNFRILKKDVELYFEDAVTFEHYNLYNYFYFFNPFDEDIYINVIENIIRSTNNAERDIVLICYGKSIADYINNKKMFEIVAQYTDKTRVTKVVIFKKVRNCN